jgi:cytidylate kinase
MRIIGLSGKIGVGKTTIALHITNLLKGWQIMSFADLIKQEAAREYGFDPALAYSKAGKETVIKLSDGSRKTVRELLQYYGTDVVRAGDRDRWIAGCVLWNGI